MAGSVSERDWSVQPVDFEVVRPLWEARRNEATCQIVRDSILPRGLADAWVLRRGGHVVGYAGVWNRHFPGRIMDFHLSRGGDVDLEDAFASVLVATDAGAIEAQTNLPVLDGLLRTFARSIQTENHLFEEGEPTALTWPGAVVRRRQPGDEGPDGEWVVEVDDTVIAGGGALTHYNPPYADLFMGVADGWRGRGVGSFLVQELRRRCHAAGLVPVARCNVDHEMSRRTLERGGMRLCGEIRAGVVKGKG